MELSEKKSVSLGAWVGLFVGLQIIGPLSKYLFKTFGAQPPVSDFLALLFTHLLMLLALGIIIYILGADFIGSLRAYAANIIRDFGVAAVTSALLLGIGALMLHYGIHGHAFAGNGALIRKLISGLGSDITGRLMMYVSVGLVGPIFEEVFYRRLLYVSLRQRYSMPRALIVAALLFALVHPEALFFQVIVGAAYCYLYERYKRLDILIFSHMMCNIGILTYTLTHC